LLDAQQRVEVLLTYAPTIARAAPWKRTICASISELNIGSTRLFPRMICSRMAGEVGAGLRVDHPGDVL
jgi:hypothetical protein